MHFLEGKGFTILSTNFLCRGGELDIVARDDESLVFVEVKSRTGGEGFEQAMGPRKIQSLMRSARTYIQMKAMEGEDYRFMILYVQLPREAGGQAAVECVEDPF